MLYDPNDYLRVIEAIEAVGGAHLPERCVGRTFVLELPDEFSGERTKQELRTAACGRDARIMLPHDRDIERDDEGGVVDLETPEREMMTVCLVDDSVGAWPRFAHAVQGDSYIQPGFPNV